MPKNVKHGEGVWRIRVCGQSEDDVHGVSLRKKISEIVYNLYRNRKINRKPRGYVKNVKNTRFVDIYLVSKNNSIPNALWKRLEEEIKEDGTAEQIERPKFCVEHLVDEFKDFEIKREDELTEMVWALQGAGDAFATSAEQQKELVIRTNRLLQFMRTRDSRKSASRLFALHQELINISLRLDDSKTRINLTTTSPRKVLYYHCLEESCTDPPSKSPEFILSATALLYASVVPKVNSEEA